MAYQINTSEFQLHLYQNYEKGQNSPWENPNLYLVLANEDGSAPSNLSNQNVNPVVGKAYFLVANVINNGTRTNITQMRFEFPSWVSVDGEKNKTIDFDLNHAQVRKEKLVLSAKSFNFLHPGDYEISVQIRSWDPQDNNMGSQPTDWPTSGSLYARNGVKVSS